MLPSFYSSDNVAQAWRLSRAAACGAGIGTAAALIKVFGPLHQPELLGNGPLMHIAEVAVAAVGFALLCTVAAAVRNFLARRLIWRDFDDRTSRQQRHPAS